MERKSNKFKSLTEKFGTNVFKNREQWLTLCKDKRDRMNLAVAMFVLSPKCSIQDACKELDVNVGTLKDRVYSLDIKEVEKIAIKYIFFSDGNTDEDTEGLRKNAISFFLKEDWNKKLDELKQLEPKLLEKVAK